MPAQYRLLPLLALALLTVAHGPARAADKKQFVVTYVEFLPANQDLGEALLEVLAALGRRRQDPVVGSTQLDVAEGAAQQQEDQHHDGDDGEGPPHHERGDPTSSWHSAWPRRSTSHREATGTIPTPTPCWPG